MQIFIAKEQLGDYFNYVLDESEVFANTLNTIDLPAYFKYMYSVDSAQECMMNESCKNELLGYLSSENFKTAGLTNQTESSLNIKNIFEVKTDEIIVNESLINIFGVSDELSTENGQLQKIKRWEKEEVSKSTTFTQTSKNGKGKCILINTATNEVFISTISDTDIQENSIPDGTYLALYQLQDIETINIPYSGDISIYEGDNNIQLSENLTMEIKGNKKYIKG